MFLNLLLYYIYMYILGTWIHGTTGGSGGGLRRGGRPGRRGEA